MAASAVVTAPGKTQIWNRLKGNGTEPKNIQWGDTTLATGNAAAANVNLFKPQTEARTAGTSTMATSSQLGDVYQVTGVITATGTRTITEVGLFDTTTASPTTTVAVSLTASATVLSIGSVSGFPTTGNYYVQIETETVLVTGANATSLTVTRGRLGSTSATHVSGSPVTLGGDGQAGVATGATSEQTATVAAASGGNGFVHADFAGIALSTNDSINFTISVTLT